jgi:ferredoxin
MAWIFTNSTQFYLHQGETLLQGLLRVGAHASHQCLEGYCGTCKLTYHVVHPQTHVHYVIDPLVMLADNEILPCCCYVQGVITLDID